MTTISTISLDDLALVTGGINATDKIENRSGIPDLRHPIWITSRPSGPYDAFRPDQDNRVARLTGGRSDGQ